MQKGWFALPWPHDWRALSIAEMELIPVIMAAALWGRCYPTLERRSHGENCLWQRYSLQPLFSLVEGHDL